ncbi:hypothetical protein EDD93_1877 [Streptomyces sp. 840.1]|uniref:hypothetical protein n=1 Tax=Streptomyces sp. 840.1 TaxID=2485152 RepID=UPI000F479242|nr:hypothetical protein [Streptomyces sp. 840.1]ROQ67441.1 hypothetical protein EDD93_1877 [Streptomyces sp. 840.1]
MITREDVATVIHLDLRSGAAALDAAAPLRARIARQLGLAGLPEPDYPLFLVVDTPAGLTDHQRQYELLTTYRAVGEVRMLVLLVGSAPGSYAGEDEAFQPDRRLERPSILRSSGIALLWAGDLRSARTALEQPAPDDPDALAVLVDLLSVPDVFLRVLDDLGSLPEAVATPGVRLLEQDLPPEVRERAWRDALRRFAGEDTEPAPDLPVATWSGADLPEPLRGLATGRSGRDQRHREPGGLADSAYGSCARALDQARSTLAGLRALTGLLRASHREAFEADLDQAREALGQYRELVTTALHSDGGSGAAPSSAEAAARLAALGLRVPSAEGVGERIGEGLREFAKKLMGQKLALRAVAQRFTGLAGQVEPVPGSALLPKLADHSAEAVARRSGTRGGPLPDFVTGPAATALAAAAGALGALWQWPLALLAVIVPLVFFGVAGLGASRLRDEPAAHRSAGPRIAAVGGAAAGLAVAYTTDPPAWLSTAGLLVGAVLAVETARRLWDAAAAYWAAGQGATALRRALDGLDGLLAEVVREHWAAEERLYCADAARSVAGMLRATAAAADAEAVPAPEQVPVHAGPVADPLAAESWLDNPSALEGDAFAASDDVDDEDAGWASAYTRQGERSWDEPADGWHPAAMPADPWEDHTSATPRWLDRESGEGGSELVATLADDLTDAAMVAMNQYWGAVERGQAGTRAIHNTEVRVRELLSSARHHLRRNGVLAPPPFAAAHRTRTGSANLLGTDPHGLAELVGAETDRRAVVQLSSPEQGTLLSRDPDAAVWIRFAPQAVRGEVETAWRAGGSPQPEDVLWTSSGRYAGLIRLTPLRMGVVENVRPYQSPQQNPGGDWLEYEAKDGDRW